MSRQPPNPHQAPLPQHLRDELERFRRQLWQMKIAESIFAGVFGLLFSYLLVFGLDRLTPTPGTVRLAILLAGTAVFVVLAPYWIRRWVWGHRQESQLARLIARKYPQIGDRLLGVIELQDQTETEESLSPRLRAAAMETVAREVTARDFDRALPSSHHRRWSLGVLLLFVAATAVLVFMPEAGMSSLKRWLMPLSDTPRYTFTRLENFPDRLVVPYGEPFDLRVSLASDTERRPATGLARLGRQEVHAELRENGYRFAFPGQQAPATVNLEIGDARHELLVEPAMRPAVTEMAATLRYPDYLQLPDRSVNLGTGALSAVKGGRVSFHLDFSRPLAAATMGPAQPARGRASIPAEAKPPEPDQKVPLSVDGSTARTPSIAIDGAPFELPFSWRDRLGLGNGAAFSVRIDPVEDAAPTAYLQGVERQKVMLAAETVEFEILGEDDFGVREIGLVWEGEFTRATDAAPARGEMRLAVGAPDRRRMTEPVAFSPGALDIPPQRLQLRAYIEDYLPGRGRIFSEPITLFVLTPDEYAQMVKSRFDRLIGELEDLARREQNQLDENQRLERLDPGELQGEEARQRLQLQQDAERENVGRMSELSDRMQELFKSASRSGEVDKETMKKMADAMQAMKELADEDMPGVAEKLRDAASPRSTPEKAADDMTEAVERQKEVMKKMRQAIEDANEANRHLEASTFVNRLKKAAREQDGIAASLIHGFPRMIGLPYDELDPSDQRKLRDIHTQQGQTASDVRWIQEDLGHFYARTNKEIYRELLITMQESGIDRALNDLRQRIERNEGYRSTHLSKQWSAKLLEWAKLLEDDAGAAGGGGGAGGAPSPEDEDFEFMLRVMQMIQKEQDLRARTRALEQYRRSLENPPEDPTAFLSETSMFSLR